MNLSFINRYLLLVTVFWSLVCVAALVSHLRDDFQKAISNVKARAGAMLERDILYSDWAESHGGVYVPVTETSLPDPYLESLPGRDIETTDGRRLTLIDPWSMTRQAFDMNNRLGKTLGKITSLNVLNPENAPDSWERNALLQLEAGEEQVSAVVDIQGLSSLRIMRPFYVEAACLKCHVDQGAKYGDVRGGISITVPVESFFTEHWQHQVLTFAIFCALWLVGVIAIALLGRKLHIQTCNVVESERLRDQAEMKLSYLSNYDRRTNLPNRFKFEEQLCDVFQKVDATGESLTVVALELRNFKQISDNFDHPVGDALLKALAERMMPLLAEDDSVAQLGEDRLLLSYVHRDQHPSSRDLLSRVLSAASKPLILEDHEFFPAACVGAAVYPADAKEARRLVQKAVSALSVSLENKQNDVTLYSQSLHEEARSRLDIESGLRLALAERGFELFLQPQVDSVSGALIGAEALIRWQMAGRGYVAPDVFIPVAEESGLILPIGEWVLQTAAIQAVQLRQRLGRVVKIGVNISARQFQDPEFIDILDEVLAIDGVLPEMLEIEITEGTFIEDVDKTIEILTDLKVRGLQIAIDDFGTGYCSLNYLKRFPLDRLKIDRSFVADIAINDDARTLVSLIVDLGHKLGLNVIAEGVEDDIQKHLLAGMGCHAMQGYFFSRPLAFEAFCVLVKEMTES